MKSTGLIAAAAGIALLAGGCTTDSYGPYYGPSQGYAYPGYGYSPGYGSPGYGYYSPRPYYPAPARYGYGPTPYPYGSGGPGITFTANFPQGTVP